MKVNSSPFDELQSWYKEQSNGTWEHAYGIEISTLDNPGWKITVDLCGTALETTAFFKKKFNYDHESHWYVVEVSDKKFKAFGGPETLSQMVEAFVTLARGRAL